MFYSIYTIAIYIYYHDGTRGNDKRISICEYNTYYNSMCNTDGISMNNFVKRVTVHYAIYTILLY